MKSLVYKSVTIAMVVAFAALCQSCGHSTVELVSPVVPETDIGNQQKVVILPFADYTTSGTPYDYWWRNVMIMEALQDELKRYGYHPVMEEDVIAYLLERGIIREKEINLGEGPEIQTLREEIAAEWSDTIKAEIARALYHNLSLQKSEEKYWDEQRLIALDHSTVKEIGARFGAKYIIRGRIIEIDTGRDDSFNPVQTGLLPFFFKVGSRTVFGIAESDTYEMIDKMAIGGLIGALAGPSDFPIEGDEEIEGHPRFGGAIVESNAWSGFNAAIWGAAGAGAAYLAHKGGRVDKAVVHLRIVVQDAETGEIVWANRAEVKTTPKSVYGEHDARVLMARAIEDAAATLMQSFVLSQLEGKYVTYDRYGTISVLPKSAVKKN
ncbi:hypothetical protein [Thermodesulforhabdus norvegica]|uniref:Curli production assembly/transport component CsgG n=1 Tax=Thermodesulforhabdus norvegica TaxID=39841 RepID=A0A1I4TTV1_9BACT|nr:hypothetical protein [Thermodesulforhabdus norvegica]SFM79983.1 hypothetical protein SAMN05660836_01513 [Thermodesulforhabdus norvegica]